jgi:hypothetical protein
MDRFTYGYSTRTQPPKPSTTHEAVAESRHNYVDPFPVAVERWVIATTGATQPDF